MKLKCRLCQEQPQILIPIFAKPAPNEICIADLLSTLIGCEVWKYDRLPKYICERCHTQLEDYYKLSVTCQNTLKKLVQRIAKPDRQCMLCDGALGKDIVHENASISHKWDSNISSMIQHLSGTLKRFPNQRGQHYRLLCECCLKKVDSAYAFKDKCLKSEAKWLQEVAYSWEKMEVDKGNTNQLVVDLSASVIPEEGAVGMVHCSVCRWRLKVIHLEENCKGCRLKFRNVLKKSKTGYIGAEPVQVKIFTVDPTANFQTIKQSATETSDRAEPVQANKETPKRNKTAQAVKRNSSAAFESDIEMVDDSEKTKRVQRKTVKAVDFKDKTQTVDAEVAKTVEVESVEAADSDSNYDNEMNDDGEVEKTDQEESESDIQLNDPRYKRIVTIFYKCCVRSCAELLISSEDLQEHYSLAHGEAKTKKLPDNTCQYCEHPFRTEFGLRNHHNNRKWRKVSYQCQIDGCKFTRASNRKIVMHCNAKPHKRSKTADGRRNKNTPDLNHFDVIGFEDKRTDILHRKSELCCECFTLFHNKDDLLEHCQTHEFESELPYQCDVCGRGFSKNESLETHILKREEKTHYYCRECDEIFWLKMDFLLHKAVAHFPNQLKKQIGTELDDFITCCGCNKVFNTEADIVDHRWQAHPLTVEPAPEGKEECPKCHEPVRDLQKHIALYESRVSYRCQIPDCAFRTKLIEQLQLHALQGSHHDSEGTAVPVAKKSSTAKVKVTTNRTHYYCCFIRCTFNCEEYEDLIEHGMAMHPTKREHNFNEYNNYEFQCPVCSKGFDEESRLAKHQQIKKLDSESKEQMKVQCEICEKVYASVDRLREHFKAIHLEVRSQSKVCPICGKTMRNLNEHLDSHANERKWECKICHARFNRHAILLHHLRVHDGVRNFTCRYGCTNSYKATGDRDRHEKLVHLGITPFGCEFCPSSFVRERDLRLHMRKHTGQKLYPCRLCPAEYDKKSEFDEHMEEHRGEKVHYDDDD